MCPNRFTFNNHLLNLCPLDPEASRAAALSLIKGRPLEEEGLRVKCVTERFISLEGIFVLSYEVQTAARGREPSADGEPQA